MTLRQRIAERLSVSEAAVGLGIGLGDAGDPRDAFLVRGASVWPSAPPIAYTVTTSPNWFGVADHQTIRGVDNVVLEDGDAVADLIGGSGADVRDLWPCRETTQETTRSLRRLAGALGQIRKVVLPWGMPVGGWFTVRTPIPAAAWEQWRSPGRIDVPPPALAVFLPGIVRLVPDRGVLVADYADSFAEFVHEWHPTSSGGSLQ